MSVAARVLALVVAAGVSGCVADGPTGFAFSDPNSLPVRPAVAAARLPAPAPSPAKPRQVAATSSAQSYVVEFRARSGPDLLGHSYVVFGRLGGGGKIVAPTHVGLYPSNVSAFAYGIAGVPATVDPVPLDSTIPPSAVYRRTLSAAEYRRLSAAVERVRSDPPEWSWTGYNCNTLVTALAREIGLRTPPGATLMAPVLLISVLQDLNEED